jgi:hypothetical protein
VSRPLTPAQVDALATSLVRHPAFVAQLQALVARLTSPPPPPSGPTPTLVTTTVYDCDGRLVRVEGPMLSQTAYTYEPASNGRHAPAKPQRPAKVKGRRATTAAQPTTAGNGQAPKRSAARPTKSTARRVASTAGLTPRRSPKPVPNRRQGGSR